MLNGNFTISLVNSLHIHIYICTLKFVKKILNVNTSKVVNHSRLNLLKTLIPSFM